MEGGCSRETRLGKGERNTFTQSQWWLRVIVHSEFLYTGHVILTWSYHLCGLVVFFVIKYCITESSFEMLYRVVCILIFCIGPVVTFEITSNCWIGQLEVRIDLLCPEYTGNGKTFCCGDPASRFCCTREEYQKDTREEHQENTRHREIKTSSDMIEENQWCIFLSGTISNWSPMIGGNYESKFFGCTFPDAKFCSFMRKIYLGVSPNFQK